MAEILRATDAPLVARRLTVSSAERTLLQSIDLSVHTGQVLCLTGPSGAGKTTLLRCCNRLVDLSTGLQVTGQVWVEGQPIFDRRVNPDALRRRVGMLFQQPVIFPGSVEHNVAFGLSGKRKNFGERVERALRQAALWSEVKDRLRDAASLLSVGQQQRLCLARTLALEPRVLLMDEPTSALDPEATHKIEERIVSLKQGRAIVVVTHVPAQAERLADVTLRLTVRDGVGAMAGEERQGATRDLPNSWTEPEAAVTDR
ncbi:MAG: ATP-binding cassette domain-containing protein [Acidobacteriota bacterium]